METPKGGLMKIQTLIQNCEQELFKLGVEAQGLKKLVEDAFMEGYEAGIADSCTEDIDKAWAWRYSESKSILEETKND